MSGSSAMMSNSGSASASGAAYPLNQWYAAAFSDEVTRQPLGRTLLERQVVLYRAQAGAPVALADRCVHRRAPLSQGALKESILPTFTMRCRARRTSRAPGRS